MDRLLKATIEVAKRKRLVTKHEVGWVTVDTTVQERAIAFLTDVRLYYKMLPTLVKVAKVVGIRLRQSYRRLSKKP
jgi:transposase, IS5 family